MTALSDERLSRPSASSMERYVNCAGAWRLEQAAAVQKVIPEGKGESAAAAQGTLIHDLNESGDVSEAAYSEAEMVVEIRKREEELVRQWASDLSIPFEEIKYIREKRFWFDVSAASAKLDLVAYWNEFCFVGDAKTGRLAVPPPVRNAQLRMCAVAAVSELGFKHVRCAIINVFGKLMAPVDYPLEDLNRLAIIFRARLKEIEQPDLLVTLGDWCLYCPAKLDCPEQQKNLGVAIQNQPKRIRWDLIPPEQKLQWWNVFNWAEKTAKDGKAQIKADLKDNPASCPGLKISPDGTTRKITDTSKAFDVLEGSCPDDSLLINQFLSTCSISLENFTTFYRDKTGASKEEAEKFIAEKCQAFITSSPRSGSVSVEK